MSVSFSVAARGLPGGRVRRGPPAASLRSAGLAHDRHRAQARSPNGMIRAHHAYFCGRFWSATISCKRRRSLDETETSGRVFTLAGSGTCAQKAQTRTAVPVGRGITPALRYSPGKQGVRVGATAGRARGLENL